MVEPRWLCDRCQTVPAVSAACPGCGRTQHMKDRDFRRAQGVPWWRPVWNVAFYGARNAIYRAAKTVRENRKYLVRHMEAGN